MDLGLEESDDALLLRHGRGTDLAALDLLIQRHLAKVRSIVFPIVLNEDDADEVTQEVFARAISSLSSFRGNAKFSTWLYRIAVNVAYSHLAARKRVRAQLAHDMDRKPSAGELEPDQAANRSEIESDIEIALGQLSPRLRSAIVLICIEGMDMKEAAKVSGCNRATLYWRLHEGRRILRTLLSRHLTP